MRGRRMEKRMVWSVEDKLSKGERLQNTALCKKEKRLPGLDPAKRETSKTISKTVKNRKLTRKTRRNVATDVFPVLLPERRRIGKDKITTIKIYCSIFLPSG